MYGLECGNSCNTKKNFVHPARNDAISNQEQGTEIICIVCATNAFTEGEKDISERTVKHLKSGTRDIYYVSLSTRISEEKECMV